MCKHIDWVEVLEGTDINGSHLHIYKCVRCGCFNIGIERVIV